MDLSCESLKEETLLDENPTDAPPTTSYSLCVHSARRCSFTQCVAVRPSAWRLLRLTVTSPSALLGSPSDRC